ncbi:MAG: class I SAM-dependent methyltransferase [Paludibacter sp.]|nr:class I SAM-dependent methyltransferase [Paludibacter sp.]
MTEIWNQRYAQEEFVYGLKPNEFYKEQLLKLKPGKILFPAEGEGRNAIFAALNGWDVVAFDSSSEAKKKAEKLAIENDVEIKYLISSMEEVEFEENSFDAIVLIFAHTENREENHRKLIRFLKPGGTLILEGFSKNQLSNNSGGPRNLAMLFSKDELETDFAGLKNVIISELDTKLEEGFLHNGNASVIRIVATK